MRILLAGALTLFTPAAGAVTVFTADEAAFLQEALGNTADGFILPAYRDYAQEAQVL